MWKPLLLIAILFAGCTIPAELYFRNYSTATIRLQTTLIKRSYFNRLPNKLSFYDTATKRHQYYGVWRKQALVTWIDTTTFYIDVLPATVVDVKEISNGLVLGATQPDVLLLTIKEGKTDTLLKGDYLYLTTKFKCRPYGIFKPPIYYYDVR